jgi:hypothetical protein
MSLDIAFLTGVCAATAVIAFGMAWATRRIVFYGKSTDNLIQMQTAAAVGQFLRPSAMHNYHLTESGLRTHLREILLLSLVVMQRLLRNRDGEYPVVTVCLIANMASAVLIFLVARTYLNSEAGLLAWGLYVTCILTYQHILFGTPIILAQMFILGSVYLIQHSDTVGSTSLDYWLIGAGAVAALAFLSSPSSRKYFPLLAVAFFYGQHSAIWGPGLSFSENLHATEWIGIGSLTLTGAILLGSAAIRFGYARIVVAMFNQKTPKWMSKFAEGRDKDKLQHYIDKIGELVGMGWRASLIIVGYMVVASGLAQSTSFLWAHLSMIIGFSLVILWITYPSVPAMLYKYFYKLQGWKLNRFTVYHTYFANRGVPMKDFMRGAGFIWIARYYWRVAPVQFLFFAAYLLLGAALLAFTDDILKETWHAAAMLLISLLPILLAEFTQAPQFGRSYFPTFVGLLIFVVYVGFRVDESLASPWRGVFWAVSAVGVSASAAWGFRMLIGDVLPARMGPSYLNQVLRSNEIEEFYTYGNRFNDAFVAPMIMSTNGHYKVHYVETMSEVSGGYMVIPGTSTKAGNMSGMISEREHGDCFDADQELNHLIESKEIEKYAIASFKTFGTSRFWGHESEVITYQDLILGEVYDDDRYRARAWLIDVSKLRRAEQAQ